MNVTLTPELEKIVNDKVNSGLYDSAVDVVSDGLRLLAEQDRLREIKLATLRKDIEEGLNSGESLSLDMDAIKRIARESHQTSS